MRMKRQSNERPNKEASYKNVIVSCSSPSEEANFSPSLFLYCCCGRFRVPVVSLMILVTVIYQVTWFSDSFQHLMSSSYFYPNNRSVEHSNNKDDRVADNSQAGLGSSATSLAAASHAYAFVIGGCDPEIPNYRNYIYNILIAAKNLRELGSQADIVAFFQMTWNSNSSVLPAQDERILHAMNIKIRYIPKHQQQSFYRTMLDKFRVLGLTEYESVILVDGDIMPMGNLDYLFEMSRNGVLRSNVVVQGAVAPMNGGFFLVKTGGLAEINQIIKKRQLEARQMGYPYFNVTSGWGHVFYNDDFWQSTKNDHGTDWSFHGGFADQGLLLYWAKYVQKDVSHCLANGTVLNWSVDDASGQLIVQSMNRPFRNTSKILKCWRRCNAPPTSNYYHFSGRSKPWLQGPPQENVNQSNYLESARHYWFWELNQLNKELQIGLNMSKWKLKQMPSLGLWPRPQDIIDAAVDLLLE